MNKRDALIKLCNGGATTGTLYISGRLNDPIDDYVSGRIDSYALAILMTGVMRSIKIRIIEDDRILHVG